MSRAPGVALCYGSSFFNFLASRLPKSQNTNLSLIIQRNFASVNSVVKTESRNKHLESPEKKLLRREELIQKIPELTFCVKNNGILGDAIVCWHPEVPFPYEMTKPLPAEVKHSESNLKVQSLLPVREVFRKKHHKTVVRELMHLTYTTKHRWFGRLGMERRRHVKAMNPLNQKRDREYL